MNKGTETAEAPRLLIVVTHLLGTGHLARSIAIAEAAARRGWRAVVASGGAPAPHLGPEEGGAELLQLPPVRSDGVNFRTLLTPDGEAADAAYLAARRAALETALEEIAPQALMTELYPFGRRVLAAEFDALLAAARARAPQPRIVCSIRDVLAPPSTPKKAAATEDRLAQFYDAVLVHGDPSITRLEDSWPASEAARARARYTGFVAPPPAPRVPEGDGAGEILVSAGGGAVGDRLFAAAAGAAGDPRLGGRRWRLLVGGADRETRIAALRAAARPGAPLTVEPVRPDFREMLGRAALSVNQAGYNTMLDVGAAGVRSVVVPFEEGGETEQRQRAEAFGARFGYPVLREAALSADRLAEAAATALAGPAPSDLGASGAAPDLGGAPRSVEILGELIGR